MKVFVDRSEKAFTPGPNLGEVLGLLHQDAHRQDRAVVKFTMDSLPMATVATEEMTDSTDDIETLDVKTAPKKDLARAILSELSGDIDHLGNRLAGISALMQKKKKVPALTQLAECSYTWGWIAEAFLRLQGELSLKLEDITTPSGHKPEDTFKSLMQGLLDVQKSLLAEDTVTLGDLLEYKIPPHIQAQKEIVAELEKRITVH